MRVIWDFHLHTGNVYQFTGENRLISIRPSNELDLLKVFKWRNSEDVRKWFCHNSLISLESHTIWFKELLKKQSKMGFTVTYQNHPLGFIYLQDINAVEGTCRSGYFIGESQFKGRGVGVAMAVATLELAFLFTSANTLKGEILGCNASAIRVASSVGWESENILRNFLKRDDGYHDIIINSFKRSKWDIYVRKSVNPLISRSRDLYVINT